MQHPYILARTMMEAHSFARETLGLTHGNYRIVNSASTIKSVRGADLYLVPGHSNRFDRFAMKGAIRWSRMKIIDVEKDGLPEAAPVACEPTVLVTDGLNPPGQQMSFDDLFSNVGGGDQMVSEGGPAAPEPEPEAPAPEPEPEAPAADAEPEKKRRRTRCKDCGVLHFKDEACAPSDQDS